MRLEDTDTPPCEGLRVAVYALTGRARHGLEPEEHLCVWAEARAVHQQVLLSGAVRRELLPYGCLRGARRGGHDYNAITSALTGHQDLVGAAFEPNACERSVQRHRSDHAGFAQAGDQRGVTLDFPRPGKPTDNAFIEAVNSKLRSECLNAHWFLSMQDACEKLEAWRRRYNEERPHSMIGNAGECDCGTHRICADPCRNR